MKLATAYLCADCDEVFVLACAVCLGSRWKGAAEAESEECMWRDNVIEDLVDLLRGLFPTQAVISEDDLDDILKAVESYLRTVQTEPRR